MDSQIDDKVKKLKKVGHLGHKEPAVVIEVKIGSRSLIFIFIIKYPAHKEAEVS